MNVRRGRDVRYYEDLLGRPVDQPMEGGPSRAFRREGDFVEHGYRFRRDVACAAVLNASVAPRLVEHLERHHLAIVPKGGNSSAWPPKPQESRAALRHGHPVDDDGIVRALTGQGLRPGSGVSIGPRIRGDRSPVEPHVEVQRVDMRRPRTIGTGSGEYPRIARTGIQPARVADD